MSRLYDLQNFCRGERDWLLDTIETLVRFESPTTDKAAVDRCGVELASRLAAIGGRITRLTRPDRGDHLLAEITDHDVDVVKGPAEHLSVLHKKKDGIDFYWVVNDSSELRTNLLRFRARGRPERWDAVSGKREPVFYQTHGSSTLVRLTLGPWDASYIVFDSEGPAQLLELKATNLNEFYVARSTPGEVIVRGRGVTGKERAFVELRDHRRPCDAQQHVPARPAVGLEASDRHRR
jgi:hypothetical protein